MGRNLYKLTKNFDDVIEIRQLKNHWFSRVLAEYLKNVSTDFHHTFVTFRQSYIEGFEIKRLDTEYS